ncbi:MAG: hypothetical protein M0P99_08800 [Candidatus Cloacimonetes bacterium]|nr:hypothetical protein [Candidatus Cloacimonadota bacterium]
MGRLIKRFSDGSYLEYDRGSFDDWCVYMVEPNGSRRPPLDRDYFSDIKELSNRYGRDALYQAYVFVYENTGKEVCDSGLEAAEKASESFVEEQLWLHKILTILYMAMIAEENKRFTKLGKRIKRLGIYKLLFEDASVYEAANFMRGMGWREIDALCRERGF